MTNNVNCALKYRHQVVKVISVSFVKIKCDTKWHCNWKCLKWSISVDISETLEGTLSLPNQEGKEFGKEMGRFVQH